MSTTFDDDLEDLSSAEDFLNYFGVSFDEHIVHVNRLHILQRFHTYLANVEDGLPEDETKKRLAYKTLLEKAYQDFVDSDALTEKVFKVFHMHDEQQGFVPLEQVFNP